MATQTSASKNFASSKQSLVIRPTTVNQMAFHYGDFSDLKNLILFVGSKPSIDEEGKLWFGKQEIKDDSIVLRNSYGKVTDVLTCDKAAEQFEIVAESEFKPEHANKVERKAPSEKGEGKMSRSDLKDALTAAKVDFKSGLTKDQLQHLYDEKVAKTKK